MILPLKDLNPTSRPAVVTLGLIVVNVLVFLYELSLGPRFSTFITAYGAIPYEITRATDLVGRVAGSPVIQAPGPPLIWLTLFTSMFMHAGFFHIAGNMLYLWIFGNNVEDLMGPVKFLLFYIGGGLVASLVHVMSAANSVVPTVGASGAVSAVLGAYLVAYPRAQVICLVFLIIFVQLITIPAVVVLLFWFVIQALEALGSLGAGQNAGVAWFAHVGGFVAGFIGVRVFARTELSRLKIARNWRGGDIVE
jgi:membrane associated rhomboid family serine protease